MIPETESLLDMGSRLRSALETFNRTAQGVRGSAVADRNGLPIAAVFRSRFDLPTVSAMATLAIHAAKDICRNLGYRDARLVLVDSEDALILVAAMAGGMSALAVAEPDANLDLVRLHLEKLIQEVLAILP